MIQQLPDLKPPHCLLLQTPLHELHSRPGDVNLVGVVHLLIHNLHHVADRPDLEGRLPE